MLGPVLEGATKVGDGPSGALDLNWALRGTTKASQGPGGIRVGVPLQSSFNEKCTAQGIKDAQQHAIA